MLKTVRRYLIVIDTIFFLFEKDVRIRLILVQPAQTRVVGMDFDGNLYLRKADVDVDVAGRRSLAGRRLPLKINGSGLIRLATETTTTRSGKRRR